MGNSKAASGFLGASLRVFQLIALAANFLFEVGLKFFGALVFGQQAEHFAELFQSFGGRGGPSKFLFSLAVLGWKISRHRRWCSSVGGRNRGRVDIDAMREWFSTRRGRIVDQATRADPSRQTKKRNAWRLGNARPRGRDASGANILVRVGLAGACEGRPRPGRGTPGPRRRSW